MNDIGKKGVEMGYWGEIRDCFKGKWEYGREVV